nr:hypothetical protein [uncultured Draconibacterium sp.]
MKEDFRIVLVFLGIAFAFFALVLAITQQYYDAIGCLVLAGICKILLNLLNSNNNGNDGINPPTDEKRNPGASAC